MTWKLASEETNEVARLLAEAGKAGLRRRAVVDAARSPDSPLHHRFEWDDAKAAEAHRDETAKHIIASFRVVVQVRGAGGATLGFREVPASVSSGDGYRDVRYVMSDDARAAIQVRAEWARIEPALARMASLCSLSDTFADVVEWADLAQQEGRALVDLTTALLDQTG